MDVAKFSWSFFGAFCFLVARPAGAAATCQAPSPSAIRELLQGEPCLSKFLKGSDARAEFIYYLNQCHLYHYPLQYFCDSGHPLSVTEIARFLDPYSALPHVINRTPLMSRLYLTDPYLGADFLLTTEGVVISDVWPESPAARAGIRRYDRLISVNGAPVGTSNDSLSQQLSERADQRVAVKLVRQGKVHRLTARRPWQKLTDSYLTTFGEIGYYKVPFFSRPSTTETLLQQLLDIVARSKRGLILDFRGNAGGSLYATENFLGFFLGWRPVFLSFSPGKEEFFVPSSAVVLRPVPNTLAERLHHLPVVVLIDRYTLSSAEIITGALQFYRRAVVVGEPSHGKGSFQETFMTRHGPLRLTVGWWYLLDMTSVTGRGIQPDVLVHDGAVEGSDKGGQLPLYFQDDAALLRAIDILQ